MTSYAAEERAKLIDHVAAGDGVETRAGRRVITADEVWIEANLPVIWVREIDRAAGHDSAHGRCGCDSGPYRHRIRSGEPEATRHVQSRIWSQIHHAGEFQVPAGRGDGESCAVGETPRVAKLIHAIGRAHEIPREGVASAGDGKIQVDDTGIEVGGEPCVIE